MDLDRAKKAWKESVDSVNWDAVTERRVMMNLLSSRREARAALSRPRLLKAAAMIAAAAILVVGGFLILRKGIDEVSTEKNRDNIASAIANSAPQTGFSIMRFVDGSTATYITASDVEVEEQSSSEIRLWHKQGKVRYQVEKAVGREFVVNANGVEIRVVGTVFVVDADDQGMTVKVEKGVVTVDSDSGVMKLIAGEEISLLGCKQSGNYGLFTSGAVSEDGGISDDGPGEVLALQGEETIPSFAQLMREVDKARNHGDNELAAGQLRKLVNLYPGDGRVVSVHYTLGKVESLRGRYAAAAKAFRKCWRSSPNGTLAEDAHFQEAISWERMGRFQEAKKAAKRYLDKYPNGPYSERMSKITK